MQTISARKQRQQAEDATHCVQSIRFGSRSFYVASLLLPKSVREPCHALYAFCRMADDAVDLAIDQHRATEQLRERLEAVYTLQPQAIPEDRALCSVVHRYAIPKALLEALIEGFEWDRAGRDYEAIEDLMDYAARVAGSVGAMMTLLMGERDPRVLARACDLGVAMQLTNIARDVGEDARSGRLYLPRSWMREAGLDPDDWLLEPVFDERLAAVVLRLLETADQLYRRATAGVAALPLRCRPAIHAARLIYAEIGREVERCGMDSVSQRAIVRGARKVQLLPVALMAAVTPKQLGSEPPLAAVRFMIDAIEAAVWRIEPGQIPWWQLGKRIVWVIELFERLERRDQFGSLYRASAEGSISRDS